MAVLSESDRAEAFAELLRDSSRDGTVPSLTKADIRAALDATDQWVDDNAVAFNNALPQPARGTMTNAQKARLMAYVVQTRWVKGV